MDAFEVQIQRAVDEKVISNAVCVASRKDPSHKYEKAIGHQTLDSDSPAQGLDTVFWIASCTKLLTSISALQCVQRGLITLDAPVSSILPEFAHPSILTGYDSDNKPLLVPAKNPITLRQLLTHTSGMGYAFPSNELLFEWRKQHPLKEGMKFDLINEFILPLIYEPGTPGKWRYSVGLDWAGMIVQRLNGNVKLGEYMETNIFKPLGIKDITFRPLERVDIMERISARVERQEDGSLKPEQGKTYPVIEPVDDCGGGGIYATARDYNKVLESLLRDDGKILDSATLNMLFTPQLPESPELVGILNQTGPGRALNGFGATEARINHGLGGIIAVDGVPGAAAKGLMCWDGLPSCYWWVDRERGTCGFYGSQLFPPGDRATAELFAEFRKAVFEAAG